MIFFLQSSPPFIFEKWPKYAEISVTNCHIWLQIHIYTLNFGHKLFKENHTKYNDEFESDIMAFLDFTTASNS